MGPPVVIASNRGPLSFRLEEDRLVASRGAGGLVSGLAPLVRGTDTLWVAAAMSDGDRTAAEEGATEAEGFRVRLLDIDPERYRTSYDVVCNQALWFVHHGLFDRARSPRFGPAFRAAWEEYRAVNAAFAAAVAEDAPEGAVVLVQDYHLALVGRDLAARRPDLGCVHFAHTPFGRPDDLRMLPDEIGSELLEAMAAFRSCGFHSERWAAAYRACAAELLGREVPTFVAPLGADPDDLEAVVASPACEEALRSIEADVGERQVLARVDRIEPTKNLLRGFEAFGLFLDEHPGWHDRVVFVASLYPSREGLLAYQTYRQEVETRVRAVNARHGTPGWQPILLDTSDDFPRSLAVLRRADVLLVNAVRDGLNLVAKEGALVNERDASLVLSREAGIHDELGELALSINPYDLSATAAAVADALALGPDDRAVRALHLREAARRRTPADWLDDQLDAASA